MLSSIQLNAEFSTSFLARTGCSSQIDLTVRRHHTYLVFSLSFLCSFSGEFIQEFYIEYFLLGTLIRTGDPVEQGRYNPFLHGGYPNSAY